MDNNKTLIAYETKQGASEETARRIAEVLRAKFGLEVDLVDLNTQKVQDFAQYRNVVVGGGVRMGRIYSKVTEFLKENDFSAKRVAFFASSAWGGTPGEYYDSAKKRFVENTLAKYPKIPVVSKEAFGGKIVYFKKRMVDNTDLSRAEAWAMELGKLFTR
jgi:menaquinone-dependent protoporphyrinogen IX oxidase